LPPVLVGFEYRREIAELLLQRAGQRGVDAVAHGYETGFVARCREQGFELQHQPLVERCLSRQAEPVALATDADAELPCVDGDDAYALALRPFDCRNRGQGRQRLDRIECLLRIFDQPLADAIAAVEEGQGVENRFQVLALGRQVAPGADALAVDHGHQLQAAAGGRQAWPVGSERRHYQAQRELVTDRREFGAQARIAAHLPGCLRRVGMHLETRGQRAQGLVDLFLRAGSIGRNDETVRNELRRLLLRRREAHQTQSLRRILDKGDQAQGFDLAALVGVFGSVEVTRVERSQRRFDAHHEVVALANQLQFGCRFADLDQLLRCMRKADAGMADERDDRRGEVEMKAVHIAALGAQRARDLEVAGGQLFVAGDLHEAQRFRSAPAARAALLFERFDRQQLALLADLDLPAQAGRAAVGGGRLLTAERLQGGEDLAPLFADAGDKEAGRRIAPVEHALGTVEEIDQRLHPATGEPLAQGMQSSPARPWRGSERRDGFSSVRRARPRAGSTTGVEARAGRLPSVAASGRPAESASCRGERRSHAPSDPSPRKGWGRAGRTRRRRTCAPARGGGGRLGEQGERIEPGDGVGKQALVAADFTLALLERGFESGLPGGPLAIDHQHRGLQAGRPAIREPVQRRGEQRGQRAAVRVRRARAQSRSIAARAPP
jgi:hypothetical protein